MEAVRERIVRWEDPTPTIGFVQRSTGLEALRAIRDGKVPAAPISVLVNFRFVTIEEGNVVVEAYPGEEHYNPLGTVHGGFALTVFDTAMSCAIHSLLPAGVGYTTTDIQVRFIRGMTKDTGPVLCEGIALHVGRSTAIAEGKLRDREGRLLGTGSTGCAILQRPPQK